MEFALARMVAKAQMLAHPLADLEAGPAELSDWFTNALDSIPYLGALLGQAGLGSARDQDRAEVAKRYEAYLASKRKPDEPGR